MAAHGTEVDPDVNIFKNRVLGIRRAKAIGAENEKLIEEIMEQYSWRREPGIMEYSKEACEKLRSKEDAGEPMSKERAKIRKQCNPKGVVGYLLESIHLNSACMDRAFNIWQYNQPPICVAKVAYQVLGPQVQQMAARNRTRRKEGTREECMECMRLGEIEKEATTV